MTNSQQIPLFPLQLVMFPGGRLDMQIFEQRYIDLVRNELSLMGLLMFGIKRLIIRLTATLVAIYIFIFLISLNWKKHSLMIGDYGLFLRYENYC